MTSSLKKQALLEVVERICFPDLLERYWENAYNHRETQKLWNENSIFFDSFKLWGKQQTETTGEGGVICMIPANREFWDIIVGIYALKVPEFKDSPRLACQSLMRNLQKLLANHSVEGEFFKNFGVDQLRYITDPDEDNQGNFFLESPFLCVAALKLKVWIMIIPKPVKPEDLKKYTDKVPEWFQQIYDDTKSKFEKLDCYPVLEKTVISFELFSKTVLKYIFHGNERFPEEVYQHFNERFGGLDDRVDDRTVD